MSTDTNNDGPFVFLDALIIMFRMTKLANINSFFTLDFLWSTMFYENWLTTPFKGFGLNYISDYNKMEFKKRIDLAHCCS